MIKLTKDSKRKIIYSYLLLSIVSTLFMFGLMCHNEPVQNWHSYVSLLFYSPSDLLSRNLIIDDLNEEIVRFFFERVYDDTDTGKSYYSEFVPYFELLALFGLLVSWIRKKHTHRFIILFFMMQMMHMAFLLIVYLKYLMAGGAFLSYLPYFARVSFHFYFAWFAVRTLLTYYQPITQAVVLSDTHTDIEIVRQTNWLRFLNHSIDNIFMLTIAISMLVGFRVWEEPYSFATALGLENDELDLYIYTKLFLFAHYMVFEGFFGVSAGKILTAGRVQGADGSKPTFTQTIQRALIRMVPGYALLYFFYPLHDDVPETLVCKVELVTNN